LTEINSFSHASYSANIWLLRFCSNGRYMISGSSEGNVFVWNLKSAQMAAVISEHNTSNLPCRDILIHPTKQQMLVCGDDSFVFVSEPGKINESVPSKTQKKQSPVKVIAKKEEKKKGGRKKRKTTIDDDEALARKLQMMEDLSELGDADGVSNLMGDNSDDDSN